MFFVDKCVILCIMNESMIGNFGLSIVPEKTCFQNERRNPNEGHYL